jgi:hypothetical protein
MTGTEFRTLHGDPTTWTTTDIESQQNLAEIDALPEAARTWLHMADDLNATADRIRAQRAAGTAA